MGIQHTKKSGTYHWDTFDNTRFFLGEFDTLKEAEAFVIEKYDRLIRDDGADRVDIVDGKGDVARRYRVG